MVIRHHLGQKRSTKSGWAIFWLDEDIIVELRRPEGRQAEPHTHIGN